MSEEETVRILRNDVLLLFVLAACAVGLFLLTKTVAAREGAIESHVAAVWYQDGLRKFTAGETERSIESFRKAAAIDRDNHRYILALADALAAGNHTVEAEQALLRLRELDPTNAEINLHLGRLAAKSGNVQKAVLYYHSSLDGMWTGADVAEQRRNVRIELIHFLIGRHDENRALSELLVLDSEPPDSELPDSSEARVQTAKMFLQVDDTRHALIDFSEAVRLDPHNMEALAGAGDAAFRLGDERKARHYLEEATARGDQSPQTLQDLSQLQSGDAK